MAAPNMPRPIGAAIQAPMLPTPAPDILMGDKSAEAFVDDYAKLWDWVENSLDIFRAEFRKVMYPLFVHCYISVVSKGKSDLARTFMQKYSREFASKHSAEINRLKDVIFPQHIKESELVSSWLNTLKGNRYAVTLSDYGFTLLVQFLRENSILLLSIANQYLQFIKRRKRAAATDDDDESEEEGFEMNKRTRVEGVTDSMRKSETDILWGPLESDPQYALSLDYYLRKDREEADPNKQVTRAVKSKNPEQPAHNRILIPKYKPVDVRMEALLITESQKQRPLGKARESHPSALMLTLQNSMESVNCVKFSLDSTLMAVGCQNSKIVVWSLNGSRWKKRGKAQDGKKSHGRLGDKEFATHRVLIGHRGPVYGLSFSHENRLLLSCSEDETVHLWSLDTLSTLVIFRGHNYPVWDVVFSPLPSRSHYFLTGSHDRTMRMWSLNHPAALRIFAGHSADVDVVQFHPNANYVASGSSDFSVKVWDVSNGACILTLLGHSNVLTALCFSHDGRYLASGGYDGTLCLWDITTGTKKYKARTHDDAITSLSFAYNGPLRENSVIRTETTTHPDGTTVTVVTTSTSITTTTTSSAGTTTTTTVNAGGAGSALGMTASIASGSIGGGFSAVNGTGSSSVTSNSSSQGGMAGTNNLSTTTTTTSSSSSSSSSSSAPSSSSSSNAAPSSLSDQAGPLLASSSSDGTIRIYDFQAIAAPAGRKALAASVHLDGDNTSQSLSGTAMSGDGIGSSTSSKKQDPCMTTYRTKESGLLLVEFNVGNILLCVGQPTKSESSSDASLAKLGW